MKLISWNVNGIRAILKKDFEKIIEKLNPDILCLQETKAHPSQVDKLLEQFFYHSWNSAKKKGYAGTAIFTKIKPLSVTYGLKQESTDEADEEGRIITLEFKEYYLITVYVPNAQHELVRLKYRQEWDKDFLEMLQKLEKKKPVIFCGDMNVAHKEIDIANPKANEYNPGFTKEEREGFTKYIENDFIDSFREFNKEPKQYTWWSYRFNARKRNIGWRIDYVCLAKTLRPQLKEAFIHQEVLGSDHCPVGIILKE